MENSLLCPFCGGEPEVKEHYTGAIRVCCFPCGVILKRDAWNTRPSPWIKITPETTLPKAHEDFNQSKDVFIKSFPVGIFIGYYDWENKMWQIYGSHQKAEKYQDIISHYMPIPPIAEEN